MRMDNMTDEHLVIAALVRKLGGEVKLTIEDYDAAKESELLRMEDPAVFDSWLSLRVRQAPVTLVGEVVADEQGSLEV
jgi:hypothetical protein